MVTTYVKFKEWKLQRLDSTTDCMKDADGDGYGEYSPTGNW